MKKVFAFGLMFGMAVSCYSAETGTVIGLKSCQVGANGYTIVKIEKADGSTKTYWSPAGSATPNVDGMRRFQADMMLESATFKNITLTADDTPFTVCDVNTDGNFTAVTIGRM